MAKMVRFLAVLIFLFGTISLLFPNEKEPGCFGYEPELVNLEGKLILKTFPGPPNYESVENGDRPEKVFILELMNPICVYGNPESELNSETVKNIQKILVGFFKKENRERARRLLGKTVQIEGTLFAAHTGHHRTKVLIQGKSIKAA